MKFSEKWLKEWVSFKVTLEELATQLTMSGLEVSAIGPVLPNFSDVVVGEIIAVTQHPNADRLNLCQVNVGREKPLNIVCGATNVREGLKVPVAIVGAQLPNGVSIKETRLRGVMSQGMICSEAELALATPTEGKKIMALTPDASIGQDLREYLQGDDQIIEVELTPNRGDCFSIKGLAREIAGLYSLNLRSPIGKFVFNLKSTVACPSITLGVGAEHACPRYVGRVIRHVNTQGVSPLWLTERLRRCGIRAIHPVVDVTNYVMLTLGQPMHAFDLAKISGDMTVRFAKTGERLVTLTDRTIILSKTDLVITDDQQPIALAGIIGGKNSAVGSETSHILLESAYFDPAVIAMMDQQHQFHTDASQRFERGIDPEGQLQAIEYATELLLSIVGGEASEALQAVSDIHLPKWKRIKLRRQRIMKVLGVAISDHKVVPILQNLGMQAQTLKEEGWEVVVPPFRHDISLEIDLIEEIARIDGYQNIPTKTLNNQHDIKPISETTISYDQVAKTLVDHGYFETITYSFVDKVMQQALEPALEGIFLTNPIASNMSVMRTRLWTGLLEALRYNLNRQQSRIRLFEMGLCFYRKEGKIMQQPKLGWVASGEVVPEQWGESKRKVDFYDIKSDLEALLRLTKYQDYHFKSCKHPAFHPYQSAELTRENQTLGVLGMLHPGLQKLFNLNQTIYMVEIDFSIFNNALLPKYNQISKFPSIRRDLAIVVDINTLAGDIIKKIYQIDNKILNKVQIFDIYQDKAVGLGQKSIALGLIFADLARTLTDEEIDEVMAKIVKGLITSFNAVLRE